MFNLKFEPMKKALYIIPVLGMFLSLACVEEKANNTTVQPESSNSLILGEEEIAVDSVEAYVWFEDQIKQNVLTMKIYCTSQYPIYDSSLLDPNHYVRVVVQSIAEKGLYKKFGVGKSFVNDIRFELPTRGGGDDPNNGSSIKISSIDLKKRLVSCEVNFFEYVVLPFEQQIARHMQSSSKIINRPMVFKGENIPFVMK